MEDDHQNEAVSSHAAQLPTTSRGVRLPIAGVYVEFPFEPYSVQKYMMNQIITSINKVQNCLLESPTGTGKTLGLLCSSLAWQDKERRTLKELREEFDKEREEQLRKLQQAKENKGNSAQASASATNPENGKARELPVSEGCEENDPSCECSSDEDIFQPSKRRKSMKMHDRTDEGGQGSKQIIDSTTDVKEVCAEPPKPIENKRIEFNIEEEIKNFTPPTIYYGTRTHKQIAQVVDQLKKTSYAENVRMTILAARDHTCVNPVIKSKPNVTDQCKHLIDPAFGAGCTYYQAATKLQFHGSMRDYGLPVVFDIEDIVTMGSKRKFCPYFTLRNLSKNSDIVFCPYNYLIHPEMRESMNINLNRNIIIMDEAHNIEDICRESASLWLRADDLAAAIKECKNHQYAHSNEAEYKYMEHFFVKLHEFVTTEGPSQVYSTNNESKVAWPGQNLIDRLHVAGVTLDGFNQLLENMASIDKAKADDPESNAALSGVVRQICTDVRCCFKYLYQQPNETKFQGFFHREIDFKNEPSGGTWYSRHRRSFGGDDSSGERRWKYALRVLCLDPALVFRELSAARCIILASGTLSPLDSFKTELGVEFKYVVKGKHVVPPKNLYVSTISNGPTGVSLRGVYENSNTYEYQDELGRVVIETAKIVPHGVLCFFPSYYLMEKLQQRWESNGMLEELSNVKEVFWEPRGKDRMDEVMSNFTLTIDESRQHQSSIGAIMFGVFRGKIAEGIDFSDDNARVVLAVGIPFTNRNNFEVNLKIRYNDSCCVTNKALLNGSKWYTTQAYRALNQALGRCIRHRNDWGAIVLVDARFAQREVQENLPVWIRSETRTFQNWGKYRSEIDQFCNNMKKENTRLVCETD